MQKGHTHYIPICLNEGWKHEQRQTLPTQMNNKIILILEVETAENLPDSENLLHGAPDKTCPKKQNKKKKTETKTKPHTFNTNNHQR